MFYIWLIVAIILGILEVITMSLVSIWFVVSAIVTMIVSLFTSNHLIQLGVFVVLGVILMPISKKIYAKIKVSDIKTNFDRIIGMKGIITEDIIDGNIGEVKVDGKKWSAYADSNILKGEYVKILSINSVKLKVEKWREK